MGCVDIGLAIMKAVLECSDGWIHSSVALHALSRTEDAYHNLAPVADKFSDIWTVSYNLARYCSQLGRLDEAKEWFKKAVVLNETEVHRLGIDDPDLQPLWNSISTMIWKKTD